MEELLLLLLLVFKDKDHVEMRKKNGDQWKKESRVAPGPRKSRNYTHSFYVENKIRIGFSRPQIVSKYL